jgi:hypothetical protein
MVSTLCMAFSMRDPKRQQSFFLVIKLRRATLCYHVGMANMDRVVHTKSYSYHNVDTGDDINSDVPEVEKTNNVNEGDHNNPKNHQTDLEVGQKNESDDEDTEDGKTNISPQFKPNNLVCLPSCIDLDKSESILKTRFSNEMVNHVLGWNMFLWTIKWEVFYVKLGSLK